jgi:hypothetical protein
MTPPSLRLERAARHLSWAYTLAAVIGVLLLSTERTVARASKRMVELETAKQDLEEENTKLHRDLDGALAHIHEQAGSDPGSPLDSKGSDAGGPLDIQGSGQSDQS